MLPHDNSGVVEHILLTADIDMDNTEDHPALS
jgi:hypothetical protein